ncbi:MAG: DNA polymerase I [Firmicutes bacterium]|nr:DNA polymerase I [Bacillota bacterium]
MTQCKTCPLYGRPKISGTGSYGGLAIIGEAPGLQEIRQRTPFAGVPGRLLRQCLKNLGIDLAEVWTSYAVLCQPNEGTVLPQEAVDLCRPRLLQELSQCKRVLLCGSTALKALCPDHKSGILTSRGRAFWINEPKMIAVSTVSPALVLRDPFVFQDFTDDMTKIIQCSDDISPPNLPEIFLCSTPRQVQDAVQELQESWVVAVDLETTDLDYLSGEILLMGLQGALDRTYQISGRLLKNRLVRASLQVLFKTTQTAAHNIGFDVKWVKAHLGIDWRPEIDTMLAHYTLDERSREEEDDFAGSGGGTGIHGLKTIARIRYNAPDYDTPLRDKLKSLAKQSIEPNFGDVPLDVLQPYLAQDTTYTLLLTNDLVDEMNKEGTRQLHDKLLVPAALALAEIEMTGVLIDQTVLFTADQEFSKSIEENLVTIRKYADDPKLNINSPKQVGTLLFETLKLPKISGQSTSKEVLVALSSYHPVVDLILDCRQKERLRSTYISGILRRLSDDGRLRSNFLLHITKTGRLASRDPNLQNIPVLIGPTIRNAFVATPGWTMIEADYNQLELRVAAWYSQDERLLQYYREDFDVHRMVAAEVFDVPPEEVTQMQRYIAKYIDFGIIYGRQAKSLALGELQCSVHQAQIYIDSFLEKFSGLSKWIDQTHQRVQREGVIETPVGRKRRFPFIFNTNLGEVLRQAVNSPIQSLASDICLSALTRLHTTLDPKKARLLLTVHDSLLIEVQSEYLDETLLKVREIMEDVQIIESDIPFKVDIKVGDRWGALDKRNI